MNMALLDHLIIDAGTAYFSFANVGQMLQL